MIAVGKVIKKQFFACGSSSQTAVDKARDELGIAFLELDWVDATSFHISDESLSTSCRFIHQARSSGASVLVHCAQARQNNN